MLSVEAIAKAYRKQTVLQNVTFSAAPGECLALIGPNGCGKSTLLQILSGALSADSGSVFLDGKNLLLAPALQAEKIGYVPQVNPLYPDMTALDHLKLWYSGVPYSWKEDLENSFLSLLNIQPFLHKKVKTLSGGMQKRLGIGCALAGRPPLLLLDEPAAALDMVCKEDIRRYIKEYCGQGNTVLLATHEEADFSICSRILLLHNKTIQELPGGSSGKEIIPLLS